MIVWFLIYFLRENYVHGSVRPGGKWTFQDGQIYGGLLKGSHRFSNSLRIPIKYQKDVFSKLELKLIQHALDDLTVTLNDCVQFFDIDIWKGKYSSYVFIRREDSDGNYDPDCWSYVGQMSKSSAQEEIPNWNFQLTDREVPSITGSVILGSLNQFFEIFESL